MIDLDNLERLTITEAVIALDGVMRDEDYPAAFKRKAETDIKKYVLNKEELWYRKEIETINRISYKLGLKLRMSVGEQLITLKTIAILEDGLIADYRRDIDRKIAIFIKKQGKLIYKIKGIRKDYIIKCVKGTNLVDERLERVKKCNNQFKEGINSLGTVRTIHNTIFHNIIILMDNLKEIYS